MASAPTGNDDFNRMDFLVRGILNRISTMAIVVVKAVDTGAKTVDVQPLVGQLDGAGNVTPHGTVHGLPYGQIQSGTFAIVIAPQVGDFGVVVFSQSDISAAVKAKNPSPPGSRRKFDWADGIYMMSVASMMGAPTQFVQIDEDGITITSESDVTINVEGTAIINGNAKVDGDLEVTGETKTSTLLVDGDDYQQHLHTGVTTGGGTSGPVAP